MTIGSRIKQIRGKVNQTDFAGQIGVSPRTLGYYENDHRLPDAGVIKQICAIGGKTANWLIYGDEETPAAQPKGRSVDNVDFLSEIKALRDENRELRKENKRLIHENNDINGHIAEMSADPERQLMVSLVGLAECSIQGWELRKDSIMSASAPPDVYREGRGFAVWAIGDSMRPAGIENNFTVFCDPDRKPLPGDIVYVEDTENHGTIKMFAELTTVGVKDFITLQGWLPRDAANPDKPQKPFTLRIAASKVKRMCTVVYIRR